VKRFFIYSSFLVGLVLFTVSYISNTGLDSNFSVQEDLVQKSSVQCSINSLRQESKDLNPKAEQSNVLEIQTDNEQPLSNNNFESKLLRTKNSSHLQFIYSSIKYFTHFSFQQSNGHYLYFLCKILI